MTSETDLSTETRIPQEATLPSFDQAAAYDPAATRDDEQSTTALGAPPRIPFVYALGRIEPRFPRLAVEKEFAQVLGREATAGLTDREALRSVLSERQNRYLVRQLCWTLTIEGLDTYLLHPRDPLDLDLLIEALRPTPRGSDIDVVIGTLGPLAPPDLCNGLVVPMVSFDQLYSFDVDALVKELPRPEGMKAEQFEPAAEELLSRVMQMSDNAGATDADRALNYLCVRYPAIYHKTAERFAADATLTGVEVRPSMLSGTRTIVEVIFAYTDRKTDVVDKHFVRVDVTEQFPFLITKLSPYFERDPYPERAV